MFPPSNFFLQFLQFNIASKFSLNQFCNDHPITFSSSCFLLNTINNLASKFSLNQYYHSMSLLRTLNGLILTSYIFFRFHLLRFKTYVKTQIILVDMNPLLVAKQKEFYVTIILKIKKLYRVYYCFDLLCPFLA